MAEVRGSPIIAGYTWTQAIKVRSADEVFPTGTTLTAHVRASVDSPDILATLTIGSGITRDNARQITLTIAGTTSADWTVSAVVLDVVRTDTTPDQHLGWRLTVPVVQPVTRGLA